MTENIEKVDVEVKEPETKTEETTAMATTTAAAEPEAKVSFKDKAKAIIKPALMIGGAVVGGFLLGRKSAAKKSETTENVVDVEPTDDTVETAE